MKTRCFLLLLCISFTGFAQEENCSVFKDVSIQISSLGINSKASDFGPSVVGNELWFSAYSDKNMDKAVSGDFKRIFYDLFKVGFGPSGQINTPRIALIDLDEGFHEGPVSFCEKTGELFVTLSNPRDPEIQYKVFQKLNIHLRLAIAKYTSGKWIITEELPFNNALYSVGHPSVTSSGDTLYFTSDIPDFGVGGTDIYMSVRKEGKWGKPLNLGKPVNTMSDEMYPYIHPDGTLIYASNGLEGGKGGLDLYYSCRNGSGFSSPVNLAELNTGYDDFAMVLLKSGKMGYFTSNRPGYTGDDDIFSFSVNKNFVDLRGIVVDDLTGLAIPGATVILSDCSGTELGRIQSDPGGNFSFRPPAGKCTRLKASKALYEDGIADVGSSDFVEIRLKGSYNLELWLLDAENLAPVTGTVTFCDDITMTAGASGMIKRVLPNNFDCDANAKAGGYLNNSTEFSTKGISFGTIRDTILMYKKEVERTFVLENIYYDFDKWNILPESEIELNKLIRILNENPALNVELGSHTDCRGNDAYNKLLSQKRSESAVGYIVKNGIAKNRIVAKGYGETRLVNKCDDGIPCTESEHRKNRRTEFKILAI